MTNKAMRLEPKMTALMLRGDMQLMGARDFLRAQLGEKGDYTPDDKFHVTLAYLTDEGREHPKLPNISSAPLNLKVAGLEVWEVDDADASAVVVALEKTDDLAAMQEAMVKHYAGFAMSPYSWPDDWRPHITLAYFDGPVIPPELGPFAIKADNLELVEGDKTLSRKRFRLHSEKLYRDGQGDIEFGFRKYSQAEAEYDPLGADDFEGCANCRFFRGEACHVVEGYISPTGYSNLYTPINAPMPGSFEELSESPGLVKWLKSLFKPKATIHGSSGFKVLDGGKRWLAWYTNAYEDKEDELFPTQALARDVERHWKTRKFPELWFYHIPGTKHGQADWTGLIGRFVVATGTFDDSSMAEALRKSYKNETVSHGFVYNEKLKVDGAYWDFSTFEISPVPRGAEANAWTSFEVMKMELSDQQKAELVKRLNDPEMAQAIIDQANDATKTADGTGVRFKSEDDAPTEEGASVPETLLAQEPEPPETGALEDRVAAIEASIEKNFKTIAEAIEGLKEKPEPAEQTPAQKAPRLSDEFRTALIEDMEKNAGRNARNQKLSELDAASQVMAHLNLIDVE